MDENGPQYNPNSVYPVITNHNERPRTVTIKETHEINDMRQANDFKGVSFSDYKKGDVKKQLIDAMLCNKLETACYWSAELICAGHFSDLWEIILYFTSKHIHIGNPKIAIYLEMRYNIFRNIMNKANIVNEIDARNDEECRKLFAEIMITLSLSQRKMSFEEVKIKRHEDFDMTYMKERLKAPSMKYAESFFMQKDPKEIFIALNEFAYSISSESANITNACYWFEWLIEFDASCKKRKLQCKCEPRNHPIEAKFRSDVIWVLWDAIMYYGEALNIPLVTKTLQSLLRLFCIRYTNACGKRRKYMLYYAISLITETVPVNIHLVENKDLLSSGLSKVNFIYKQVKKNEQTPSTEYLFHNIDKQMALERSMKQMEIINSLDTIR
tara:strand:- start:6136 stop:7287 length:1152 start_codon:yes stop_codon:yes gene_type:complete